MTSAAPNQRFPNASQDAVFPTEKPKGDATGPAPGVAAVSAAACPCGGKIIVRDAGTAAQEDAIRQAYLRGVRDGFQQGALAAEKRAES